MCAWTSGRWGGGVGGGHILPIITHCGDLGVWHLRWKCADNTEDSFSLCSAPPPHPLHYHKQKRVAMETL